MPRAPEIGDVLDGRYRLDSLMRRGGMGTIYLGTQVATGRTVVLKVIRADLAGEPEVVERFLREARAASLLSHPHTIRLFDFGQTAGGNLYMVLEYLPGRTLAEVLTGVRRLPERRVLKVVAEASAAVAEAHAAGLVHGDLKPENLMLVDVFGDPDFVKVFDFGIACFPDEGGSGQGSVVGTPHYMAPERAAGEPASPAVDVYALGVVAYEALTGVRPFDGPDAAAVMLSHVHDPVPEVPPECPVSPGFRFLLSRVLAKSPSQRPSAAELVRELESLRPDSNAVAAGMSRIPATRVVPSPPITKGVTARLSVFDDATVDLATVDLGARPPEAELVETVILGPSSPPGGEEARPDYDRTVDLATVAMRPPAAEAPHPPDAPAVPEAPDGAGAPPASDAPRPDAPAPTIETSMTGGPVSAPARRRWATWWLVGLIIAVCVAAALVVAAPPGPAPETSSSPAPARISAPAAAPPAVSPSVLPVRRPDSPPRPADPLPARAGARGMVPGASSAPESDRR